MLVMEDDELAAAEQHLHDILANTLDEIGEAEDLARQRAKQVCVRVQTLVCKRVV